MVGNRHKQRFAVFFRKNPGRLERLVVGQRLPERRRCVVRVRRMINATPFHHQKETRLALLQDLNRFLRHARETRNMRRFPLRRVYLPGHVAFGKKPQRRSFPYGLQRLHIPDGLISEKRRFLHQVPAVGARAAAGPRQKKAAPAAKQHFQARIQHLQSNLGLHAPVRHMRRKRRRRRMGKPTGRHHPRSHPPRLGGLNDGLERTVQRIDRDRPVLRLESGRIRGSAGCRIRNALAGRMGAHRSGMVRIEVKTLSQTKVDRRLPGHREMPRTGAVGDEQDDIPRRALRRRRGRRIRGRGGRTGPVHAGQQQQKESKERGTRHSGAGSGWEKASQEYRKRRVKKSRQYP